MLPTLKLLSLEGELDEHIPGHAHLCVNSIDWKSEKNGKKTINF